MAFGPLIDRLRDALDGDNENQQPHQGQPYGNVLPASQDPYGDPADQQGYNQPVGYQNGQNGQYNQYDNGQFGNVLPASQDPLGDPADQEAGFGNVLPASQDPYGDPADQEGYNQPVGYNGQGQFGNVLPASQDPLGDPADEQARQQQEQGGLGGLLGSIFKRV